MNLITESYIEQTNRWPKKGRHILAQFDENKIVVYQAYNPPIGEFAARHGYFGGEFRLNRMSWIKPNFMWMMYRSGWGAKPGQEVILAIHLKKDAFNKILTRAVHSSFISEVYGDEKIWRELLSASMVRLQWDPDHGPAGEKLERRAVQLGLNGENLERYAREWITGIEDISGFVKSQREIINSGDFGKLLTPKEDIYPVVDSELARRLQISGRA